MKKFVKISSIVVLVLWSLLVILGLSFGTGVARKIVASVKEVVEQTLNNYDLYDVNIIEQREYVAGKTYTLSFDTKGNVKDKDYELLFKSLNTDVFTVNDAGVITCKSISGDKAEGILVVTSNLDKEYRKEIKIVVINASPNSFDIVVTNLNSSITELIVGVPFYVSTKITSTNEYSLKNITYMLDEEYFVKITNNKYLPIKATDSATLKAMIGTTVHEEKIKIVEKKLDFDIDRIRLFPGSGEETKFEVGTSISLSLVKNTDKSFRRANVNYNIRIEDTSIVTLNALERLVGKKEGTTKIYVDILDSNNNVIFTKEKEITIYKKVVSTPPKGPNMNTIPDVIETLEEEHKTVSVTFPKNSKFVDIPKGVQISINEEGTVLKVYVKTVGEYQIKVVATANGITEEKIITIKVEKDSLVDTYKKLMKNAANFVAKIMGHLCLFLVEGIVAIWCIFNNKTKSKWLDVLIYISVGLSIGALTEFIQIFLEGRNPAIKDVGIDFTGYLIGGTIAFILIKITLLIWAHVHRVNGKKKVKKIKQVE